MSDERYYPGFLTDDEWRRDQRRTEEMVRGILRSHSGDKVTIYVGDANDVMSRIIRNHCNGNVEASALRCAVAQNMGYPIKRTRRWTGSVRMRIDLPEPQQGESKISAYIRSGEWKYVICESYDEAHDFQWYAIDQLKPLLNCNFQSWNTRENSRYQTLLRYLLNCRPRNCTSPHEEQSGPGVYAFFHELTPTDFKRKFP